MSNRLKIYACSGIGATGATKIEDRLVYELEGSKTLENSRAMNMLLSQINYYRTMAKYGDSEHVAALNSMDFYSVCYWFARKYRDEARCLELAGINIAIAVAGGKFILGSTDPEEHAAHVEQLIEEIDNETGAEENADPETLAWWREYVEEQNVDATTEDERKIFTDAIRGIGALDKYGIDSDSDLSKFLNDAGSYFTYYVCVSRKEASRISLQAVRKWDKQKEVYDYCVNCFVGIYGTEESMIRIIQSGLMETYDRSLEEVHDDIISGRAYNTNGIGPITEAIAMIIVAIISMITSVILSLIDYGKSVANAKYRVPTDAELGILSDEDYTGGGNGSGSKGKTTNASMGFLPVLLLGGAAIAMFGKKL